MQIDEYIENKHEQQYFTAATYANPKYIKSYVLTQENGLAVDQSTLFLAFII